MRLQISFKPYSAYSQAMASAREQQRNKQVIRQYSEAYAVRFAVHEREKNLISDTESYTLQIGNQQ
jgi:ABC-type uncharacterized transport system involved in gliding motility auxiliary subunit